MSKITFIDVVGVIVLGAVLGAMFALSI